MKSYMIRSTAKVMLCVMIYQLVVPATKSFALTTGPSQPEVQSFEPVGTTDMVDLFSGDFAYNIPLLDVEGYPVNISYHSGINMEQEASWVGLGWNINPGEINRNVRGVPDDFNGDPIYKKLKIKDEEDWRFRAGVEIKPETFGYSASAGLSAGMSITFNNYKGMGIAYDGGVNGGLSLPYFSPQVGMGFSVGSQDGATVDAYASIAVGTSRSMNESVGSISLSGSTGFNTRSGLRNVGLGWNINLNNPGKGMGGMGAQSSIPIGLQNYVPVITNATKQTAYSFQIKLGPEVFGLYPSFDATLSYSNLHYDTAGTRKAYGYLYAQNANDSAIMDFSREKDGMYNSTLPNLPLSSMTYDIYSITGQGTGGMFRPFRNDLGSVFDPIVSGSSNSSSFNFEAGLGGAYEFGANASFYETKTSSGPWFRKLFKQNTQGYLFENTYFKQAGEMSYSMVQDNAVVASHDPVAVGANSKFIKKGGADLGAVPANYGTLNNRTPRANHLSFLTNAESAINTIGNFPQKESYQWNTFVVNNNNSATPSIITKIDRTGTVSNKAKNHHIGEMTQVLPDGRRYVYGLPAINNVQKEVTFAVLNSNANLTTGMVAFEGTNDPREDSKDNDKGTDNYYQATYTPAYAHSYLLTSVLSPDYMDITGDGLTEDDLGNYTKFNYTRTDADFRWIAPIQASKEFFPGSKDSAQYNPGFWSDLKDDKANYTIGSREMWYMHSIESKNMVAEFYTSPRLDGKGVTKKIVNAGNKDDVPTGSFDATFSGTKGSASLSYKLDSIKLYNKHDRILNGTNAVPIKTVFFVYDYSLCPGVPNNTSASGKLTLKRIFFRYGNSDKSLVNPYEFTYSGNNKSYNFGNKDRWGNYKDAEGANTNYEFPYVKQEKDKTVANANASNWHLTGIKLPSGGNLKIEYEADDYSYVQDRRTMEMTGIAGVGAGPNFTPRDVLYEDLGKAYDYIYFKRDTQREIPGKTMKENYLDNEDNLYFSFNVDLASKNAYENIKGYAKIETIDACPDNGAYGYIKVKLESAGLKSGAKINPVTLASLNIGRTYLPHIIYPGTNASSPLAILKALQSATGELLTITQNANERFIKKGLSKKFRPNKSWIRLDTPGYTKTGGGTRVRSLQIEDGWNDMTSSDISAMSTYGQIYEYKTLLDNKVEISSGVASYEPMVGADEIPQRRPANKYTSDGGRLLPTIEFNQEEPFGESLYPGASVGYSKVTVRSINKDIDARSSKSKNVQEFYTAKDFPIETDFTEKSVPVNQKDRSLTNRFEEVNVLQGYVLRMNDMHGKPKTSSNYVVKKNGVGSSVAEYDELITSTKYNYQTQNGRLYNMVKAVKRDSLVRPTYSIADMVLGEETDFSIDNRMREVDARNLNVSANVNAVGFGPFIIPIPTVFFPDTHEKSVFKTMVSTKVIQQYGILKSVETVDHGARVVTENMLYDSETGQVLLTKVNNEFNDPVSNLSMPAYWAYDNMGPSYFNTGYEEIVDSVYIDANGRGYMLGVANKRNFNLGDELLMRTSSPNTVGNFRVWITDMKPPPVPPSPCGTAPSTFPTAASDGSHYHCDGNKWWFNNGSTNGGIWSYYNSTSGTWVNSQGVLPGNCLSVPPTSSYLPVDNGYPASWFSPSCNGNGWTASTGNNTYKWNGTSWIIFNNNGGNGGGVSACDASVPVFEPRAKFPAGNATRWITFQQGFNKVYFKVIRSGRRNQLGSAVQTVAMLGNFAPSTFASLLTSPSNVLSASANTYAENANADEFTLAEPYGFNDYILGKKGNFRDKESYAYLTQRKNTNNHNRSNGVFTSYQNFWTTGTDNLACSLSDIAIAATSGNTMWKLLKTVTQYSAYGLPVEEQDAAGIYSTALYGYNHSLPIAVGSNISKNRLRYFSFEDPLMVQQANRTKLGIFEILNPVNTATTAKYRNGLVYGTYPAAGFGTAITITNLQSHTGNYSVYANTSEASFKLGDVNNFLISGNSSFCYVSMWVKASSGVPGTTGMYIRGQGKTGAPLTKMDLNAFSVKTNSIDGWYKFEGKVAVNNIKSFMEIYVTIPAGYYVDDVRFYPDAGNMKSFAYDMKNMRLMAELDENNFATFYEYDQEGVLVRVKKESDRGILTVSENRKSNAKKVQ